LIFFDIFITDRDTIFRKVVILKTKVGIFMTDCRIISENNPPILIGTHIFTLNKLHKNT
jgi:hypothetical protein